MKSTVWNDVSFQLSICHCSMVVGSATAPWQLVLPLLYGLGATIILYRDEHCKLTCCTYSVCTPYILNSLDTTTVHRTYWIAQLLQRYIIHTEQPIYYNGTSYMLDSLDTTAVRCIYTGQARYHNGNRTCWILDSLALTMVHHTYRIAQILQRYIVQTGQPCQYPPHLVSIMELRLCTVGKQQYELMHDCVIQKPI